MISPHWEKFSYSQGGATNCVEVATDWHTSSYSTTTEPNCVEVAESPRVIKVRDSQNRPLGHLTFTPEAWTALLGAIRNNEV